MSVFTLHEDGSSLFDHTIIVVYSSDARAAKEPRLEFFFGDGERKQPFPASTV